MLSICLYYILVSVFSYRSFINSKYYKPVRAPFKRFPSSHIEVLSIHIESRNTIVDTQEFPSSHIEVLSIRIIYWNRASKDAWFPSSHIEVLSIPLVIPKQDLNAG